MKKLLFALLITTIFYSCNRREEKQSIQNYEVIEFQSDKYFGCSVVEIDSCEYLIKFQGYEQGWMFTHKGNCKYCTERNKSHIAICNKIK